MGQGENIFLFNVPEIDNGKAEPTFRLLSFSGREELSRPYSFLINLMAKEENITGLILKEANLTIRLGEQSSTYYGIISNFDQLRKIDDNCYYQACLMPKWHLLSLYRMSDVYLNQSLPEIIAAVFTQAGFTTADYRLDLKNEGNYSPPTQQEGDTPNAYNRWSYVCQYEETCLDFLSRLMEREGIYYYFDQRGNPDDPDPEKRIPPGQMVITDDKISHPQSAHKLFFKAPGTPSAGSDDTLIQDIVFHQRLLPQKVVLKNYDYEQASLNVMTAEAFISSDGKEDTNLVGCVNIFGENFSTPDEGQVLANIRAEEILCEGNTYTGFGTAVPLVTGDLKYLTHENEIFTGWYLVVEVRHEGNQSLYGAAGLESSSDRGFSYTNSFTFIRDTVQFRPRRVTAKPKIHGTTTAFIDSSGSGDYADLDTKGRYLVSLPFTLTPRLAGKASTRIRMATPYAAKSSTTFGMHLPLLKGTEVLLSFRDGDPDLPTIAGAAFNSQNTNPVAASGTAAGDAGIYSPENLVIESAGGNKIVMNDTKDKESILLHSPFEGGSNVFIGSNEEGEPIFSVKASGDKHEVIIGQEDDLVIGSLNIGVLGSLCETVIGTANELHVGAFMEVELGQSIEMKAGRKMEYGDTHDKVKKEEKKLAHELIEIAAGSDPATMAAMESVKSGAAAACAAAGAIIAAAGGDIAGAVDPEGKNPAASGVIAESCIAAGIGLQVLAYQALSALTTELANPAAKLTMNSQGIKMMTLPTALYGITIGTNEQLSGYPGIPGTGIIIDPSLNSGIEIQSNPDVYINIYHNYIEIRKKTCGNVKVDQDGVVIVHEGANAGKIEVKSDKVIIQKQGGGVLTLDAGVKLEQGGASVELSGNQVKLAGQGLAAMGTAISVDAAGMIKLGG